ncbi:DNA-binding NarL/FixJ family response regulator [Duganella sp. 1224]|uniref:response regulator n=1 Tax=Duganella sp. 1224 TaxID=2587052 RepID=UPI001852C964|nr:response regulator transcription factor [Duganella sp. 1224]NYE59458.1 DNA-binding NarL/FixJ family response regulator [Duganella sp. 1224]
MEHQLISVMIADDHPLLRSGIAAVLSADPRFAVVAEAGDGDEALAQYQRHRPDITLMDLQMPGLNGIEATLAIRAINPRARVIILTTYGGEVQVARGLKAGASGYILKNMVRTDLVSYIAAVCAGRQQLSPQVACSLANTFQKDTLSKREVQVLRVVADGNSNQRAAEQLGLSEDTIKAHMKTILQKLDARDRTHAVMIAMRRGYWEG